jgi:DNA-binding transcriptional LysR family regulator
VQEGVDAIDAVRHGEVGSIRIGASPSIATYMLPRILKRFRDRRPRVHVHLMTGTSEEVIERLTAGDVHLTICRLTQHPDIEATHLYNDDLALAVAPNHHFVARRSVSVEELSKEPFLFFERSASYHGLIYGTLLRLGVVPESVMELDSMETTKHMVEANLGIAVLPVVSIAREVEDGRLRIVEIAGMEQPPQREVGVHVIRNRTLSAPIDDLVRLLREQFIGEQSPLV